MKKGFTLIELLVTISIIGILSAALFIGRSGEERELALRRSALQLSQDIREVQEMARNSERENCNGSNTNNLGLYLDTNQPGQYIIFADCDKNHSRGSGDKDIRVGEFEGEVELSSLIPSSETNVVFEPPRPIVYINGSDWGEEMTATLSLSGSTRNVKINSAGRIEIE